MLTMSIIGHIGADCEKKSVDGGKTFAAIRVAHSESYKDSQGVVHEKTQWVDVTLDAEHPVVPFLLRGTQVYVRGLPSFRVFSSEKDRCMKVGVSIRAREIQLLSSPKKNDDGTQRDLSNHF